MESKSVSDLYVLGNQAVATFKEWFTSNRLTVKKNTFCNISQKTIKKLPAHSESLKLDSETVEKVQNARFLEALIDQHLSWDFHISNVSGNLAKFVPTSIAAG